VNCQYEVKPHKNDTPLSNTTGADGTFSTYWDLPLNVKILDLIICTIAFIGLFKILPIVIGKVKNIFANKKRKTINIYIQKRPGSTIREISKNKEISYTNTRHHILMLERAGKIILTKVGKFLRAFPTRVYDDNERKILQYLNNETGRSILIAILEMPGITNHELTGICEIEKSSIHWHIERLLKDNIIRSEKDGKFVRYYIEDEVKDDLLKLIPIFTKNNI
jgi:predicted transcriptional regulator